MHHKDDATFYDASIWEDEKLKSATKIKALIDDGLHGTSVTAILIGSDTALRRWVKYEIIRSFERGKGIIGVHINRIRCKERTVCKRGLNPLDRLAVFIAENGAHIYFMSL